MTATQLVRTLATEPRRPAWVREREGAWRLAVLAVCIGAWMGQLDASIVTAALPTIQHDLHAGVTAVAWVGLAYLVALVATIAAIGRLSDAVGRKLVYVYGFGVFTAASLACALAPSLDALIAFRVVQGVGAAMLQANSVAIVALATPRARLGRAVGAQGAAQALGLAAGPTIGGLLLALGGWRLLFLVNVPAGLVGIALGLLLLPRSTELRHGARVDVGGLVLLVPAVALTLCAISMAAHVSVGATVAIALAAVALVAAFVVHERRAPVPLLDVAVLRTRAVALGVSGAMASYVVLFGLLLAVPFFLERGLNLDVAATGAVLAALPAAMCVAAPLAGHASERLGTRRLMVAGMAACAAALSGLALAHGSPATVAGWLALAGAGLGSFTPTNNTSVLRAAPRANAAEVSGLLNMGRGLGTGIGLAASSLVLAGAASRHAGYGHALGTIAWALCAVALAGTTLALAAARRGARDGVARDARGRLDRAVVAP